MKSGQLLQMAARNIRLKFKSFSRSLLIPVICLCILLFWLTMREEEPKENEQMHLTLLTFTSWISILGFIFLASLLSLKFSKIQLLLVVISSIPLLLTLLFFLFRIPQLSNEVPHKREFFAKWKVGGHRGSVHDEFLENSLEAFSAVKKEGGELVEMDIEVTKDGVPVICHDSNVERLSGVNKDISSMTLSEFRQLRYLGTNVTLPTFEEAVAHCVVNDILMVWDVKTINDRILKLFVKLFQKHDLYSKVLVSGFNPEMYLVKQADANILTSYTFRSWELSTVDEEAKIPRFTGITQTIVYILDVLVFGWTRSLIMPKFLGVDAIFCHVNDISKQFQSDAASNNIFLAAWTSNNAVEQIWLRDYLRVPFLTDNVATVPH